METLDYVLGGLGLWYFSTKVNSEKGSGKERLLIGASAALAGAYFGPEALDYAKEYFSEDGTKKLLKAGMAATAAGVTYGLSDQILDSINQYKTKKAADKKK